MPRNILVYFLYMEIAFLFVLKVLQCESLSDQIHTFIRSGPSTESLVNILLK